MYTYSLLTIGLLSLSPCLAQLEPRGFGMYKSLQTPKQKGELARSNLETFKGSKDMTVDQHEQARNDLGANSLENKFNVFWGKKVQNSIHGPLKQIERAVNALDGPSDTSLADDLTVPHDEVRQQNQENFINQGKIDQHKWHIKQKTKYPPEDPKKAPSYEKVYAKKEKALQKTTSRFPG